MRRLMGFSAVFVVAAGVAALGACTRHTIEVQPIKIEPIYMTIDVNLKVDRELDRFFDYEDAPSATEPPASDETAPAPPAASPSAGSETRGGQ